MFIIPPAIGAREVELGYYFQQVAPGMDWREARDKLWRSVEIFGIEGSPEKEKGIESQIVG